jgi:NADPH:quinone reductase-like Zn-dependent oxidoreductase
MEMTRGERMARAVRYDRFGEIDELYLADATPPDPAPGQVRVRVRAAGINPVDYKILHGGAAAERYGARPPCGVGHDFAGEVDEVGSGVTRFRVGDRVFGGKRNEALADYVVIGEDEMLLPVPEGLPLDIAGSLAITGRTAWASVEALGLGADDIVLVSAAAGGVGVLAAQLAVRRGAAVIGSASASNHEFLRSLGVIPVEYGENLVANVRSVAPRGLTAVLDNHGTDTIDAALELGVPIERVNTIAARGYRGAQGAGGADASLDDLAHVAALVAAGELDVPVDSVYPIERVQEAYRHLAAGHLRGKIVVVTE